MATTRQQGQQLLLFFPFEWVVISCVPLLIKGRSGNWRSTAAFKSQTLVLELCLSCHWPIFSTTPSTPPSCTRDVSIVTQLLATLHDMELERAIRTRKSSRTFVCIPLHVHQFHLMCGIPVGTGGVHGAFTQFHSHDNQSMQLLILVRHSRHQQPLLSLPDYWVMMTLKSCPVRDFLRQRLLLMIHSFISSAAEYNGIVILNGSRHRGQGWINNVMS